MTHPADREAIDAKARKAAEEEKWFREQLKADTQQVMNLPAMRRILWLFMLDSNVDGSAFGTNAMAQSHAIGRQDGAKWFLNLIREYCPEKEAQIRREGLANRPTTTTEDIE